MTHKITRFVLGGSENKELGSENKYLRQRVDDNDQKKKKKRL